MIRSTSEKNIIQPHFLFQVPIKQKGTYRISPAAELALSSIPGFLRVDFQNLFTMVKLIC